MINELSETQKKRRAEIKSACQEILNLEDRKFNFRVDFEKASNGLKIGFQSRNKLNQTENAKGWAANILNAEKSKETAMAQLEEIKQKQREMLKKIENIINI